MKKLLYFLMLFLTFQAKYIMSDCNSDINKCVSDYQSKYLAKTKDCEAKQSSQYQTCFNKGNDDFQKCYSQCVGGTPCDQKCDKNFNQKCLDKSNNDANQCNAQANAFRDTEMNKCNQMMDKCYT